MVNSPHRKMKKKKRQMAAAAGKKEYGLSVLFSWRHLALEWNGRRAPHCGYSDLGRRGVDRQMAHRTKEAWMSQVLEVQTWRRVRGLAGAVMCETRDLGIKWPSGTHYCLTDKVGWT